MSLVINNNQMASNVARNLNSHYSRLSTSTQRLSSGLRVNSAADDAAGLAIRELMRTDVAALHQGARNANDAISLIQVADGALSIIDEKLIRMKELAEQAATGTYDSTQRLMIDSEFQAMAAEIDRIANATDFNGIHLLDGSLNGEHDGSGLNSIGKMKIHFGSANDSAEDYYYIEIGDCTTGGLGLRNPITEEPSMQIGNIKSVADLVGANDNDYYGYRLSSGIIPMAFIPKGSKNVVITIDGRMNAVTNPGLEDDIQIFTRDGYHLSGTSINNDNTWRSSGVNSSADANIFMSQDNGFYVNSDYVLPNSKSPLGLPTLTGTFNTGLDAGTTKATWSLDSGTTCSYSREGSDSTMNIYYSGDYSQLEGDIPRVGDIAHPELTQEKLIIDEVSEDLILIVTGALETQPNGEIWGDFNIDITWEYMPPVAQQTTDDLLLNPILDIQTQDKAQKALVRIDEAIIKKDKIRANLGALQNRFENTVSNLNIQAENLQAAESRISDVDVATEMTQFVRNQILTQSAVAMLSQANSMPQMAMQLING